MDDFTPSSFSNEYRDQNIFQKSEFEYPRKDFSEDGYDLNTHRKEGNCIFDVNSFTYKDQRYNVLQGSDLMKITLESTQEELHIKNVKKEIIGC